MIFFKLKILSFLETEYGRLNTNVSDVRQIVMETFGIRLKTRLSYSVFVILFKHIFYKDNLFTTIAFSII